MVGKGIIQFLCEGQYGFEDDKLRDKLLFDEIFGEEYLRGKREVEGS